MVSKWPLPVCETDSFWDSNLEKTAIYLDFSGKNGAQKSIHFRCGGPGRTRTCDLTVMSGQL